MTHSDDLLALVLSALAVRDIRFIAEPSHPDYGSARVLRLSARNVEIGDLLVWVYSDEVIVGFDARRSLHDHFDQYSLDSDTPSHLVPQGIAEQAADFVADVLDDQIVYEVGERSSATIRATSEGLRTKEGRTYLRWSGPFQPPR